MTQNKRTSDSDERRIPPVVVVAFSLVVIATFVAGFFVGDSNSGDGKPSASRQQLQDDRERLFAQRNAIEQLLGDTTSELNDALADKKRLEDELQSERTRVGDLRDSLAEAERAATAAREQVGSEAANELARRDAAITAKNEELLAKDAEIARLMKIIYPSSADLIYGEWGAIEELKTANWGAAGEAAAAMSGKTMKSLYDELMAGKSFQQLDPALLSEVNAQNMKLIELVGKFSGKVPTHAPAFNVNAAFAHPLLQFNLLSAALTSAGHPLTARQLDALREAGELYDRRWAEQQKLYDAETLMLRKLLDELELKFDASSVIDKTLTPNQYAALFPQGMRHVISFDIYSPAIMLQVHIDSVMGGTPEFTKSQLATAAATAWSLDETALIGDGRAIDAFLTQCAPLMKPQKAMQAALSTTLTDTLLAGRAQLQWVESALSTLRPDEDAVSKIRAHNKIMIPRVLLAE